MHHARAQGRREMGDYAGAPAGPGRSAVRADKQIDLYRAIAPALAQSARAMPPAQIIDAEPPAALPAPAPTLPDVALLSDVLADLPRGRLCYGVTTEGPMLMTFGGAYHILYGGGTRSGKSNALDSLLVQLHHQTHRHGYKMRLLIGDFKRELRATWQRSPWSKPLKPTRRRSPNSWTD
jgi:hypothetical protein